MQRVAPPPQLPGEWFEDEQPKHTVVLDGVWIDQTEVTNAQYRQCVEAGGCEEPGSWDNEDFNAPDQRVVLVTWYQAQTYGEWTGGRLPTEAEWEYAASGSEGRTYPCGASAPDCDKANYWGGSAGCIRSTTAVGSYPAGASWCGAQDLTGNVWEWVADWFGDYPSGRQVNPTGPSSGTNRVLRGGS